MAPESKQYFRERLHACRNTIDALIEELDEVPVPRRRRSNKNKYQSMYHKPKVKKQF